MPKSEWPKKHTGKENKREMRIKQEMEKEKRLSSRAQRGICFFF